MATVGGTETRNTQLYEVLACETNLLLQKEGNVKWQY